ncbi:MAG: hypothetical protein R3F33_14280 [Planctomycetota bacterium]
MRLPIALALIAALFVPSAAAQGQEAGSVPREVMWQAPTRADWENPA